MNEPLPLVKFFQDGSRPKGQHPPRVETSHQPETDSGAALPALREKRFFQERGLVHQAVLVMLDPVNSSGRDDVARFEVLVFHLWRDWPEGSM